MLVAAASAAPALPAISAPTPVPGGANQIKAVTGKIGTTVFNGVLRVKISGLKDASDPTEISAVGPSAAQKVMVFDVLLRNGAKDSFIDLVRYALADKDDVTVQLRDIDVHPANLNILQASAAKQHAAFAVDKDFVPVKLLVTCATCGDKSAFRPIRFTIP